MAALDPSATEKLRRGLRGSTQAPGDEGYDEGRAFNLNATQIRLRGGRHERGRTPHGRAPPLFLW